MEVDALAVAELAELAASEDGPIAAARGRAGQEIPTPSPPVGALLAWLAGLSAADAVVEVGAAAGVSGLWLLRGMNARGTLTSIESDRRTQEAAHEAFDDNASHDRVRTILGEPLDVLERLSDASYDLLIVQSAARSAPQKYPEKYLDHGVRLLRPAGVLVVIGLAPESSSGPGADTHARTPKDPSARQALTRLVIDDQRFQTVVLPLDDGVLLARMRPDDDTTR